MLTAQIILGLSTLGALTYTVLAYPNKYGALSGRAGVFRPTPRVIGALRRRLVLLFPAQREAEAKKAAKDAGEKG